MRNFLTNFNFGNKISLNLILKWLIVWVRNIIRYFRKLHWKEYCINLEIGYGEKKLKLPVATFLSSKFSKRTLYTIYNCKWEQKNRINWNLFTNGEIYNRTLTSNYALCAKNVTICLIHLPAQRINENRDTYKCKMDNKHNAFFRTSFTFRQKGLSSGESS